MTKFKVLLTNTTIPLIPEIAQRLLKTECDVVICEEGRNAFLSNIEGVDALFWWSNINLDKEILDKADLSVSWELVWSVVALKINTMLKKAKVLVASYTIPEEAVRSLRSEFDVRVCEAKKDAVLLNIPGVDGLFWSSHLKLDDEILDKAGPQLKAIGVMSAGYDHINISELKRRGIKLGNTPVVLNDAVADIAVLLCLAAARRYVEARQAIEESRWSFDNGTQWMLGQEISNSTVGIVGLGGVGVTIARRLKGFNVDRFLYTGHKEKPEGSTVGAEYVGLDYLLENSDFVFACVPLNNETENMFNARFFSMMKKTAVFVNISRGATVNQNDLIAALKANRIFAAGLDVMTPEPLPPDHELLKLPNCVITPHLGSATRRARENMAILTAKNISNVLNGKVMETPVVW